MLSRPLTHLHLDLTNHCQFRCEYCFQYGNPRIRRGFMQTPLALRIIDECAAEGLDHLATSVFGEALLHRDVFPIVDHAVRRGLGVTLNTRGGLLHDENCRRLCTSGISKLIVSLNTPDEWGYRLSHGPSHLDFAGHVQGIRRLLHWKLRLRSPARVYIYILNTAFARPRGLDIVSDQATARDAVALWRDVCASLAPEHGLAPPRALEHLCQGDLTGRKWDIDRGIELLAGVELVFKEAHLWGNRLLGPDLVCTPTTRGSCPLPRSMLTIHWDGDCSLCCLDYDKQLVVGSLKQSSLLDVLNGARLRRIQERMAHGLVDEPLCQRCLGGLSHARSGRTVRRPRTSRAARVLAAVHKYGPRESLRYVLRSALGRLSRPVSSTGLRRRASSARDQ